MITNFEVKNFKKFDHLVVENLGQINLITGDNNVGKSCLLEALTLKDDIKAILSYFHYSLQSRGFKYSYSYQHQINEVEFNHKNNIVGLFQKQPDLPIQVKCDDFDISIHNTIEKVVNSKDKHISNFIENLKAYPDINLLSRNWLLFYINHELRYMVDVTSKYYNQFINEIDYSPLITLDDFYRNDLIDFLSLVMNGVDEKKEFLDIVNSIFHENNIIDIQLSAFHGTEQLNIATETKKSFHSITQYGGGFVRTFRIILELFLNKNGRLMIDEIDTGIHFLRLQKEWETIFVLAQKLNVQLFATTHSFECIKSFQLAASNNIETQSIIRLIELEEFRTNDGIMKQKATTYNYETLKYKLDTDTNIRGGNVWL